MTKAKREARAIIISLIVVILLVLAMGIFHYYIMQRLHPEMGMGELLAATWDDILHHPFDFSGLPISAVGTYFMVVALLTLFGFLIYMDAIGKKHYATDRVQGDQKFLEDLDSYNRRFTDPIGKTTRDGPNNMILSQDLFLCMDNQQIRRNLNVFCIGGSGAGKSFNLVGPNILQANTSFVITDPSGGLFKQYGYFLEYMGYKVKCFNLAHMNRGNHYNPFNYIHSNKDIEILVTTLISNTTPPDKKGGDPFWEKSETALLVALIAYLYNHSTKECQNFSNVMRLMRSADIDENDSSAKSPLDAVFEEIEDPEDFALRQYKTFKMGAGKTLKGILISCSVRLQQFDLDEVADLTDTDDIDLDSVGDEKTALFVIIPTGDKTFSFLSSMMYSQLFQRMYEYSENTAEYSQLIIDSDKQVWKTFRAESPEDKKRARAEAESYFERAKHAVIRKNADYQWYEIITERGELVGYRGSEEEAKKALAKLQGGKVISNSDQSNHGQRLPIHTRLLLDEFANTGKIPEFSEKVATVRKYEISCTIILQSLNQMKNLYKDDWETITGNCDNTLYLGGGADETTCEWISKLLGKETRTVMNANYSKSGGGISLNRTGVELYTPAQLRTMDENDCIVIPKSMYAYKGRKYRADKHPMRPLVNQLEKERGAYFFQAQKATDLLRYVRRPEALIVDEHGAILLGDEETMERRNENDMLAAGEFKNNGDINGTPVIGSNKTVQAGGQGLEETVPLKSKEEKTDSLFSTLRGMDDIWAPDEILYGETKAEGVMTV